MNRKLETILIKAKKDVYNYLSGNSISKILGEGYDFAELREYQITDDIRHISWVNSAKSNKIYIKKMYEEKEINISICPMIDGRFIIGDKLETLSYIVALLGYSAYTQNNMLSSIIFFSKESIKYSPAKNIENIEKIIRDINSINLLGRALNYKNIPQKIMNQIEPKSLIFLIGDFLESIDLSILSQKHEIVVIIVRDKWEENPIAPSSVQLINPQTNKPIERTLSKKAIKYYKTKLKEHDTKLFSHFNKFGIRYMKVYDIDEVYRKFEYLSMSILN